MAFCSSSSDCGAADLVEQAVAAQLVGDGDDVDRLAGGHQPADGGVDVLVRRLVEVLDLQAELGHLADHVARQQQRAEQALLGVEVVRRHPASIDAALRSRSRSIVSAEVRHDHLPCQTRPVDR